MKFFHLSDLHLGRKLRDFPLIDDQRYILDEILEAAAGERPDGVIIAGDVYDKSTPSEDAVKLLDSFLTKMVKMDLKVFLISGNHDSAERLAFGEELVEGAGVYISPVYDGNIKSVEIGDAVVHLMPFIREINVRPVFPDKEINNITDAARAVVESISLDKTKTNILVAHQFVTGTNGTGVVFTDDQTRVVGGIDNIDAEVFKDFDYVALGHIHRPQKVAGSGKICYCGSPLKYTFDDDKTEKSIQVVETTGKSVATRRIPLKPKHELKVCAGSFAELMAGGDSENYVKLILTETGILDARARLTEKYARIAEFEVRTDFDAAAVTKSARKAAKDLDAKMTFDIIKEFFKEQTGEEMTDEQIAICENILSEIDKGEK